MSNVPIWTLNNGYKVPSLGFGVFRIPSGDEGVAIVKEALSTGYRLLDTASMYENEEEVGRGMKESGLPREEIILTTKMWNDEQGYDETLAAFDRSLKRLGTDYIDLYLVHWAVPGKYIETYKALEKLYREGKVRAIGVCNFQIHHLEDILRECEVVPVVNQVELHPLMNQKELRDYCKGKGIQIEAWGPLMRGIHTLDQEPFLSLGKKYGKSPAQVILRWHHQNGVLVIPKSVTPSRIRDNISIFDFELAEEDMKAIDGFNKDMRLSAHPDHVKA
jgi:diketogulonate reductase-like aldo/keto reductase